MRSEMASTTTGTGAPFAPLMKAKQRVPALRGGQPGDLAANGVSTIEFCCGAPRRDGTSRPTARESGECRLTAAPALGNKIGPARAGRERQMKRGLRGFAATAALLVALCAWDTASAQKRGGILRMYSIDSPASMSILEEATIFAQGPMMGVFNNLVMFDQHVKQNSLKSIVPDLASSWLWNEEGAELTFKLRQGVKWHDGKPFTAGDVKCTWDLLMDTASEMRRHPIGTGPFKFAEFKPNEDIKVTRNPDYWKPDRPYLDGIEYTIIKSLSTAALGFIAGKFDATFIPVSLTVPLLRDVQSQMPQAICELTTTGINRHLLVNYKKPPFDNPELRRAMALSLDRQAFIDTISQGQGEIGGVLPPAPDGLWGMPPEVLATLPGYGADVAKNRAEARKIMEKLG